MDNFVDTPVIKKVKRQRLSKSVSQENLKETAVDVHQDNNVDKALDELSNNKPVDVTPATNSVKKGRKSKYATQEERAAARKAQQKAYRERKKKELAELKKLAEQK